MKAAWICDLCQDVTSWGSGRSCYFSLGSTVHATMLIPILIPIPCILPLRGTWWHNGDENVSLVPALPCKIDLVQLKVPVHLSLPKAQGKSLQRLPWCITLHVMAVFACVATEIIVGDTTTGLLQYQPEWWHWCGVCSESSRKWNKVTLFFPYALFTLY